MSVTEEAIDKIKQMIVAGAIRPGERLPPEKDFAAQLSVSRNSLREAVRALSMVRVLDARQGDGTYVTSLEADVLLEATSFVVDLLSDATVLELFQVRRLLEPAATALATVRMADHEIVALSDVVEAIETSEAVEDRIRADVEFHRRIVAAAGNSMLASLISSLSNRTVRVRSERWEDEPGIFERTVREHRSILDAIEARDPELAHAAVTIHIAGGELWLRERLGGGGANLPLGVPTVDARNGHREVR